MDTTMTPDPAPLPPSLETPTPIWDPQQYRHQAGFVPLLGLPVLDLLHPQPGERILDLGCGEGSHLRLLQERGCHALGIDQSATMVAAAQALGVEARVMAAETMTFEEEFDAIFSNAALHWMTNPDIVIAGVWRALKPGGRFVGEMGGEGNVATLLQALISALKERGRGTPPYHPWFFPHQDDYGQRLIAQGFQIRHLVLSPRPTPLPQGLRGWLETFAMTFLQQLPPGERDDFLDDVVERCRPTLFDVDTGAWWADYVRLRFAVEKPTSPNT